MRKQYPKFLCATPKFLGLDYIDLMIIGAGMFFSLSLGGDSFLGVIATIVSISLHKLAGDKIDFIGLRLSIHRLKTIDLNQMYRRQENENTFV